MPIRFALICPVYHDCMVVNLTPFHKLQDVGRAEMSVLSQMLNGRPLSVVELTLGRPRSVFSRARVENCDLYTIRVLRHRPGICK